MRLLRAIPIVEDGVTRKSGPTYIRDKVMKLLLKFNLVLLALFLALAIWLMPKMFRYLARIWRGLGGRPERASTPRLPS